MKRIAFFFLLLASIGGGFWYIKNNVSLSLQQQSTLGGMQFNLINQDGKYISNKKMLGKYTVIFFGFSRCSSICPTQLAKISAVLEALNSRSLQAFFISIDPYDTVDKLKDFHGQFDERIQMLTGPKEEIENIVNSYKVFATFSEDPEKINHSTILYIMGKDGKYLDHFNISASDVDEAVAYMKETIR